MNRARSARKALKATGRELYANDEVLKAMPKGIGSKAELVFFRIKKSIFYPSELDAEYRARGLVPADPFLLAAHNEADPHFGDVRSNATVWRDKKGQQCHLTFFGSTPVPYFGGTQKCHTLNVGESCEEWGPSWWFAGVREGN